MLWLSSFYHTLHEWRSLTYQRYSHWLSRWSQKRNHRSRWTHRQASHNRLFMMTCAPWVSTMTWKNQNNSDSCTSSHTWYEANIFYSWSPSLGSHGKWDIPRQRVKIRSEKMTNFYRHSPRGWDQSNSTQGTISTSRSDGRETSDNWREDSWSPPSLYCFRDTKSPWTWGNISTSWGRAWSISDEDCSLLSITRRWETHFYSGNTLN